MLLSQHDTLESPLCAMRLHASNATCLLTGVPSCCYREMTYTQSSELTSETVAVTFCSLAPMGLLLSPTALSLRSSGIRQLCCPKRYMVRLLSFLTPRFPCPVAAYHIIHLPSHRPTATRLRLDDGSGQEHLNTSDHPAAVVTALVSSSLLPGYSPCALWGRVAVSQVTCGRWHCHLLT